MIDFIMLQFFELFLQLILFIFREVSVIFTLTQTIQVKIK